MAKVKFSQTARLRADARMMNRAASPLLNLRTVEPGDVRFGLNLASTIAAKLRGFRKGIFSEKSLKHALMSLWHNKTHASTYPLASLDIPYRHKVVVTKKPGGYRANKDMYRLALLHELGHTGSVFHNPDVAANALGSYLGRMTNSGFYPAPHDTAKLAQSLKTLSKPDFATMQLGEEYKERPSQLPLFEVGIAAGEVAAHVEKTTGKAGAGMFFIREFIGHREPGAIIEGLRNGVFDAEMKEWAAKNPRFVKILKQK